jgi:hypothetical protein
VLVRAGGLVPPLGTLPSAYVAERTAARAVASVSADALEPGGPLTVASDDPGFLKQVADALKVARFEIERTTDVTGAQLAAAARSAARLAAATAAGTEAATAAAALVIAEVDAYARRHGARAESFASLANGDGHADDGAPEDLLLLAAALREDGAAAPAVTGLADVVAGRVEREHWAATVTESNDVRQARAA